MRVLLYESNQVVSTAVTTVAAGTFSLRTPTFRPRTPPKRGVGGLVGAALNAKPGDTVKVAFTVRIGTGSATPFTAWRAQLSVFQAAQAGNEDGAETAFPATAVDVSAAFHADGRVSVDVQAMGICAVGLLLTPYTALTVDTQLWAITQVMGDEQAVTVQPLPTTDKAWPHD